MPKHKHTEHNAVLVTGASTGIGQACAEYLAHHGYYIFAGVRKEEDAKKLNKTLHKQGRAVILDVTNQEQIDAAMKSIQDDVGENGLAGLVNNAGIVVAGPLEFLPVEEIRKQMEVNVIGQVAVTRAAMPLIRKAKGRIVNMGSSSGYFAAPYLGPYAMSKFAMEAFSDSLRAELKPWGIEVVIVEPGAIATPIWEKSESYAEEILDGLPKEAHDLYYDSVNELRNQVQRANSYAIAPENVAKAVHRGLSARTPKTRYRVGIDAHAQYHLTRIPDRWRDSLVRRVLGV